MPLQFFPRIHAHYRHYTSTIDKLDYYIAVVFSCTGNSEGMSGDSS